MKAAKRILFSMLILSLVIALTACGSQNASSSQNNGQKQGGDTQKSDNTTQSKQSSDSSSKDSSKADTNNATPALDLKGRTITIAAYFDPAPKGDTLLGKELVAQQKKVEKEYNVKIKYMNVPYGDATKKLTSSVLAGKPFADMVRLSYSWSLAAAGKKEILPVSSFVTDASKYKHLQTKDKIFGNNYGFDTTLTRASGIWYNREIFNKLNLPDPHKLVKEGKWTWSEFEKLAKQATVDNNGDGKNDYWGISGSSSDLIQFLLPSNDTQMVNLDTGKVNLTDPKVIASYDFMKKLYKTDHVWKSEPKSSPDNWKERNTFKDGDVAMAWGYLWEYKTWKSIDTGFVPFPKGPSGKDWSSPLGMAAWFIPKGVKNPQDVIAVYNAMQDVKPTEDYFGQNYVETRLHHQDDIDQARMLMNKLYAPPYQDFDLSKFGLYDIDTKIVIKNQSSTSVLKSDQQKAQSVVSAVLNPKK